MRTDLSRVGKGRKCLYAENPGFVKAMCDMSDPSYLKKPEPPIQLAGPMTMTGITEYYGWCIDELMVQVEAERLADNEKKTFFMKLSELIVLN